MHAPKVLHWSETCILGRSLTKATLEFHGKLKVRLDKSRTFGDLVFLVLRLHVPERLNGG